VLAFNLTVIIKGGIDPDSPPSVFGVMPLATLSGSMSGDKPDSIETGDLILLQETDFDSLQTGDIVTYKYEDAYITHRLVEKTTDENGITSFTAKGDANDDIDSVLVTEDNVIGKVTSIVPGAGDAILFARTPLGILLIAGVPIALLIGIDVYQRRKERKRSDQEKENLELQVAELEQQLAASTTPTTQS
jgi:signal peptidase